ncbi:conserved hypothetical protein [Microsporum canis CBS 113480]|uniref:Uncharacterized protein n=1 Tax=Arthroderma otae (strain ATCC MYA-4605 / CBS 113480) TaxID=554155 RepID=C5G0E8_ARTOC|nr:conserved hypothetical protein [Microsporum canis CBS 113480]EEQ35601.1 conserved hypothetical protein [Microsporum canis CBS 113480]
MTFKIFCSFDLFDPLTHTRGLQTPSIGAVNTRHIGMGLWQMSRMADPLGVTAQQSMGRVCAELKFKKGDINEFTRSLGASRPSQSVSASSPCRLHLHLHLHGADGVYRRTSTKVSSQFLQELDQKIKDREFLPKTPLQRIDGRWAQMLPEKEQRLRVCEDARPLHRVLTRRQSYLLRDPPQDAVEDGDDDAFEAQVLTRQARYRQGLCPISSRMPLPISRRSLASSSSRPPYETRASSNEARKRGEGWRNRLRGDTKDSGQAVYIYTQEDGLLFNVRPYHPTIYIYGYTMLLPRAGLYPLGRTM